MEHIDVLNINEINGWLECGRLDSHEIGQRVPVLPIGVPQISEYCFAHVGGPTLCYNLSRQFGQIGIFLGCTLFYPEVDGACLL